MAEKDGDGPSLELPSLGFGRKHGKKAQGADDGAPVAPELAGQAPDDEVPDAEAETAAVPAQTDRSATHLPPAAPPEPAAPPLFVDEVDDTPTHTDAAPPVTEEQRAKNPKRRFRLPAIGGMAAALITGAVVGVLMVGLTGAGFRLCEVLQGTPSCGDPGFLLLAAIVVVVILVGKAMLGAWSVPDPGSTSFLAVGLLAVVALLFLVDALFNWWMIIVIPVLAMACFALSHWVTTAFVEPDE